MNVGAIHGRLLTAWSVAGIVGPLLVNGIRDHQVAAGLKGVDVYSTTMYLMAGLLIIGMVCNLSIRPVADRYFFHDRTDGAGATSVPPSQATPYAPTSQS